MEGIRLPSTRSLALTVTRPSERGSACWLQISSSYYGHLSRGTSASRSSGRDEVFEFVFGRKACCASKVWVLHRVFEAWRLLSQLLLQCDVIFRDMWWVRPTFIKPTEDPSRFSTRLGPAPRKFAPSHHLHFAAAQLNMALFYVCVAYY